MAALARLRGPIDEFFDHVTVNDPDPGTRERRLNLLLRFRDAVRCAVCGEPCKRASVAATWASCLMGVEEP